jgi:glutaredoxin
MFPVMVGGALLLAGAGLSQQRASDALGAREGLRVQTTIDDAGQAPPPATLFIASVWGDAMQSTRLDLDLDDVPVADAIRRVCELAKVGVQVDEDVPKDKKVTLKAKDIRLSTALDLISQAAGVGWAREIADGKTTIRVGKTVRSGSILWRNSVPGRGAFMLPPHIDISQMGPKIRIEGDSARIFSLADMLETRSTFNCPHCKKQATVLRRNQPPRCTTCNRPFQTGWQVCPFDGTKRPTAQGEWRFCPFCGKAVRMDEKEAKEKR